MKTGFAPLIVCIGGTPRPDSTTARAVRTALAAAEAQVARKIFGGASLAKLPLFIPGSHERTAGNGCSSMRYAGATASSSVRQAITAVVRPD